MGNLDERCAALLGAVNAFCETGSYRVLEESELLHALPPSQGVDGKTLSAMLDYLARQGYIEVSYADGGEYCLRPLPEGRLYSERKRKERARALRQMAAGFLLSLAGSFVGGLLGCMLVLLFGGGVACSATR